MVALLNSTVHLVSLQFSFSNPDAIPVSVKRKNQETPGERVERKSHSSGVMVIEPTEKCSLRGFVEELESAGYELVDAFTKERIDAKDPTRKRMYHMVRFIFARREFVRPSPSFEVVRDAIRAELGEICKTAMWRVRAFMNPYYEGGKEMPGESFMSVNLEVRTPLFLPDGRPVTVWQKDESGERVGKAPLPLAANRFLRITEGAVAILTA